MSFGLSVATVSPAGQETSAWYVLKYPDGTFETLNLASIARKDLLQSGTYRLYSYGDINPGTITSDPTTIPLPYGATSSAQRMVEFTLNAQDLNDNNSVFRFYYDDRVLTPQECSSLLNSPTDFIAAASNPMKSIDIATGIGPSIANLPLGITATYDPRTQLYWTAQGTPTISGFSGAGVDQQTTYFGSSAFETLGINRVTTCGDGYLYYLTPTGDYVGVLDIRDTTFTSPTYLQPVSFVDKTLNSAINGGVGNVVSGFPAPTTLRSTGIYCEGGYIYMIGGAFIDSADGDTMRMYKIDRNTGEFITYYVKLPTQPTGGLSNSANVLVRGDDIYFYTSGPSDGVAYYTANIGGVQEGTTVNATLLNQISTVGSPTVFMQRLFDCRGAASKMADKNNAVAGDIITYTLMVSNGTTLPYTNVAFSDSLPSQVTFIPGSVVLNGTALPGADPTTTTIPGSNPLAPGTSDILTFKVKVNDTVVPPDTIVNTGIITYTDNLGVTQTANPTATTNVVGNPNFNGDGFVKSVNKTSANVGDTITYTFTLKNKGNIAANNVVITDPLSSKLTYAGNLVGGTGSPTTGIIVGTIAPGATATVTFDTVITSGNNGDVITDFGLLDYQFNNPAISGDPISGSNTSNEVYTTIGTQPSQGANLSGSTKSGQTSAQVGDIITYTITARNIGALDASPVVIQDTIPNGATFVAGSTTIDGNSVADDPSTGITIPNIVANGGTSIVKFDVLITTLPVPNPMPNIGNIIFSDSIAANQTTSTNQINTNVTQKPGNISGMVKTVSNQTPQIGQTITYTITIPNNGGLDVSNVILTDILTTGLSFVTGSATVNANPATGDPTTTGINVGTIPANTSVVVKFDVLVNTIPTPNPFTNHANVTYDNGAGGTGTSGVTGQPIFGILPDVANLGTSIKGVSNPNPSVGDTITYGMYLINNGSSPATNVVLTDTLTTGLTFIPNTTKINSVLTTDSPLTGINVGTIPGPGVSLVTFDVHVDTIPTPNPFTNVGALAYTDPTGNSLTNTIPGGDINVTLPAGANLGTSSKGVNNGTPTIGDTITYTITIPNTGSVNATNVIVTDALVAGLTFVSGSATVDGTTVPTNPTTSGITISSILAGSTAVVTFMVSVTSIPTPNPFTNKADITYTDPTGTHVNPVTGGTITVPTGSGGSNLGNTSKYVNNEIPNVGDTVIYTIDIPNSGTETAQDVKVYDPLPAGLTLVGTPVVTGSVGTPIGSLIVSPGLNIGSIAPSTSAKVTFQVRVDSIPNPNPYINTAQITYTDSKGTTTLPATGGNLNVGNVTGANIGDSTKKVSDTAPKVGDIVAYTVSIPNLGPADATNVTLLDILPTGIVLVGTPTVTGASGPNTGNITALPGLNIGTINAGATAVVAFNVQINAIPNPNPFKNKVDITYTDPTGTYTNPVSGGIIDVQAGSTAGNLGNTSKFVDNGVPNIGQIVNYTIEIPNSGTEIAQGVKVYDQLPIGLVLVGTPVVTGATGTPSGSLTVSPGLNIGSISPGTTAKVTFQIRVDAMPTPNPYINTAQVTYTDSTGTTTFLTTGGNLNVGGSSGANVGGSIKKVNDTAPQVGDIVTYTVTVPNTGVAPATNVIVYDALVPELSLIGTPVVTGASGPLTGSLTVSQGLNIGTIQPGGVAIITFKVAIKAIPSPNPYQNKVVVTYTDPTGTHVNPVTGGSITVKPASGSNLSGATKNGDVSNAAIGDVITYTVNIPNSGTLAALNVTVFDSLPAGLVLQTGSTTVTGASGPNIGSVNTAPGLNIGSIAPGITATVKFGILVVSIPNPATFVNKAEVTYTDANGKPGGVVTPPTSVNINSPNFSNGNGSDNFKKTADKQYADIGDTITYTFTVTNSGNVPATNVTIADALVPQLSFVPGSILVNGSPNNSANIVTGFNIGTIAPNQTVTVSFKAVVLAIPAGGGLLVNKGNLTYTFTKDPAKPNGATGTGTSTPAQVQINSGKLGPNDITKTVDKNVTANGDILTFTVGVHNPGNVTITNVVVTDTLSSGLVFIPGSVVVNGITLPNANVTTGVSIPNIGPGQTSYLVFKANVTAAAGTIISNTAIVNYQYIVDPQEPPKEVTTPSNTVQIDVADISIVKLADKEFVAVGDTITYTNTITNTGNMQIENIVFTDIPPIGTTYVDPSVSLNGMLYPLLNPSNPIDLGTYIPASFPLQPGETITIKYKVTVDSIPQNQVISNVSSSEFEYMDAGQIKTSTKYSNETTSTVREGELNLTKIANKDVVEVGDILTYTIVAENTGNIEVENVVSTDILPPETEFIVGSVIAGSEQRPNDNPATGINLGTINAGESVIVVFSVTVLELPTSGEISNITGAKYEVFVDPNGPAVTETKESNELITQVENVVVTLTKQCTPKSVVVGNEINYSFTIINNGSISVSNIKLFDELPNGVEFVNGSFVGSTQTIVVASDLITGVDIGDLASNEQKEVSFKVTLTKRVCPPTITNKAKITYEYELFSGQTLTKTYESNECSVDLISLSFKQSFKDGNLKIPTQKPDIESLLDIDINYKIINIETIDSPKGTSQSGQILTGKKLLVNIKLCIKVTYVSKTEKQTVHSAHYEIYTCEYVIVSDDIQEGCCSSVDINIEDIYYEKVNNREIFYNITYLIDTCC